MGRPEKIRLGDVLIQQKLISQEQLKIALDEQRRSGRKLGRILVENGFVTEDQICEGLARQFNIAYVNLKFVNIAPDLARKLPETQARRHRAIVLEERKHGFLVGMSDPSDLVGYDEIARALKRDIELAVVNEALLLHTIDRVYRRTEEISGLARALEQDIGDAYIDFGALGASASVEDAPVVRLLQTLFEDAAQVNASDIHIEPQERRVQIRFRIDGLLILQAEADVKIGPALVLRLKLMAGLDISEKRLPQDGRFNVRVRDQQMDVRISTMPVAYGESAVLRLLNQSTGLRGLDRLGLPGELVARVRTLTQRSSGMVLVTGPTGSGKTTTLYAALSEINTIEKKIVTVEDPIEYRLPGVSQVQVNEKIDLTFGRVLRSVLRHDPDVILVGEMRDQETAQIGLRAAITGHLVFSTLHTRDAASTPIRLVDMGAPPYMVATSLQAVLAQRLMRVNCESCAEPYLPAPQEHAWLEASGEALPAGGSFMRGRGCSHCHGTGYQGRTGIYELLEMDAALVDALNRADPAAFAQAAQRALAGRTLRSHALATRITSVTVVRPAAAAGEIRLDALLARLSERVTALDLMLLSRQLHTLLRAGVPILRALASLQEGASNPALAKVLQDLRASLDSGRELSASMRRHPQAFSPYYVAMVRVGEMSGRLEEIFLRLAQHLDFELEMRARVKSALRYPSFVVAAMVAAILIVNLFVIPVFAKLYEGMGAQLPVLTRALIAFSNFTVAYWPLLGGAAIAAWMAFRLWVATPRGRYRWDRAKLRIPIAGKILTKATLARFARSFALSVRSGVPLVQALSVVARVVENEFIGGRIEQMRDGVERGESIMRTAVSAGVFSPVVVQMIAVGEETGALDELMLEIATMYERDVEYDLKNLASQIEPILIVLLAVGVLILALGVLMPIWGLGRAMLGQG